jgi:ATP/maltotriose-dependent transcriptional regulator MalT
MGRAEALDQGRESFRLRAWGDAFVQLSAADREAALGAEDLERLALAAHLTGREADRVDLLARAHQSFLSEGASRRAARCAFWLGFTLLFNGDVAQAGGWLSRAGRLIEGEGDCVEQGYLLVPAGLRSIHEGDAAAAYEAFTAAVSIGERFGDTDLVAMARHGQGRALIRQGDTGRGVSLLDEAMIAVLAGEVSPEVAGAVYCSVIESCQESLDLRRAQEWTTALDQWCATQPDLVPYRGHCLLQRAEIKQLRGAWAEALEEAARARERLSQPTPKPAVGAAFYRIAELHRLRGEFTAAEEAYRQANQWERAARPGLALLRLAQGQVDAACEAIHRALAEPQGGGGRARILEAAVEIALAARDVAEARASADELAEIASRHVVPYLDALSAGASGAVLLAEHDGRGALAELRRAWTAWRELEAPYEGARVRVLIALACREEGDAAAAEMELGAAREVFEQLGAAVDLARVDKLARRGPAAAPLTGREVQVLGLLASGLTNRQIAERLRISEKTVARHLSNIYLRIGVSTRSAATAYAYQNGLV